MLCVKSKPLPPISGFGMTVIPAGKPEEASTHSSGEFFPPVPDELSVEEVKDLDPTGMWAVLKKIIKSIPTKIRYKFLVQPEVSSGKQILKDNLSSRESSIHDTTTVQEMFNEIKQQSKSWFMMFLLD